MRTRQLIFNIFFAGILLASSLLVSARAFAFTTCSSIADQATCASQSGSGCSWQNNQCTSSSSDTSGSATNCGGDSRLQYVNGLCIPKSDYPSGSVAATSDLTGLILLVIRYLLILSGMIAVLFLIIGGFWYITAAGNEEQAEKGRKALTNAIIGMVIIILAYAIVSVVTNTLTRATPPGQ